MIIALLHPGDLTLGQLLFVLLLFFGVPALGLVVLVYAVCRWLSARRGTISNIQPEENRGTTAASGGGSDRA